MELARIRRDHPRGTNDLVVSIRNTPHGQHVEVTTGPWCVHLRRSDLGEVLAALERARLILASDNPPKPESSGSGCRVT